VVHSYSFTVLNLLWHSVHYDLVAFLLRGEAIENNPTTVETLPWRDLDIKLKSLSHLNALTFQLEEKLEVQ